MTETEKWEHIRAWHTILAMQVCQRLWCVADPERQAGYMVAYNDIFRRPNWDILAKGVS